MPKFEVIVDGKKSVVEADNFKKNDGKIVFFKELSKTKATGKVGAKNRKVVVEKKNHPTQALFIEKNKKVVILKDGVEV